MVLLFKSYLSQRSHHAYVQARLWKTLVMHNIWGLRTMEDGKEGRNLIGKAILSDLYVGSNQPNIPQEALLISRIEAILPQPSSATTKHNLIYKYPSIQAIENNKVLFAMEAL